ncbi:type II toxin-antitoxin system VapB family antitoxin [Amycolatopsis pittospori]|uniref:type II toxin-antitoxin system VapB family antitoxin n=1 Tax=Amycolatopsis pittospori TaxID=2749434 RepID=UPI0015F03647|nr:type II toxin-antitoxin system VapB family antitoxin [Amycolatopsis pittospori]
MSRTNIDIDDDLVATVMQRYGFTTKKDAVDFALRKAAPVITTADILSLEGIGWDADLDEMRDDSPERKWRDAS